jgi:hypothetical protein
LDVQICFAGAPLLPNMTKEIFLRMINLPQTGCRSGTVISYVNASNKKNAFGLIHPPASQVLKFGNLAVLALSALDPRFCAAIFR